MNKKRRPIIRVYKGKIFIYLLLVCFLMIGLGYASLASQLNMNGSITIKKYDKTLYGVLEKAAEEDGTYATEYTGPHQDSIAGVGDKKIYHWYANNDTDGADIKNMNNVVFAGHCWQMIRTTDTGGVKMIYNGEAENDQCLNTRGTHVGYEQRTTQSMSTTYYYGTSYTYDSTNNKFTLSGDVTTGEIKTGQYTCKATTADSTCTSLYYVDTPSSGTTYYVLPLRKSSHYSQFGTLQFNQNYMRLSDVGYMYNTIYTQKSAYINTETILTKKILGVSYWYADSVTWGSPTANNYNLNNPYKVSSKNDYPNLVGKYTFMRTNQNYTSTSVLYIAAVSGSTMYCIELSNAGNHTLADFNDTYTYGTSYTDHGNGTYTINDPAITVYRSNWYTSYSNIGGKKYMCKNATNNTCSELWYVPITNDTNMTYFSSVSNNYKYAKEFEYRIDPNDGVYKYFLKDDNAVSFWDINDNTNRTSLNNAHYTCWNTTGECTTISYIFYYTNHIDVQRASNDNELHYIEIKNGKSIENVKNEMLYNDNVNTTNSVIKTGVDAWFEKYLLDYSDYLEDTVFCNDRSQSNANTTGWNPNGGNITEDLRFKEYNLSSDLSCTNETDRFSTLNDKARLKYKVGLMSAPEMNILNNNNIWDTDQSYWLASPYAFNSYYQARVYNVNTAGKMVGTTTTGTALGVRPAISLLPGTEYSRGNGSMDFPYVVAE